MPKRYRADVLAEAAAGGTDLLVLTCEADVTAYGRIPIVRSLEHRRAQRPTRYTVRVVPGLDHSMHAEAGRLRAVAMIDEYVRARYVGGATGDVERREQEEQS